MLKSWSYDCDNISECFRHPASQRLGISGSKPLPHLRFYGIPCRLRLGFEIPRSVQVLCFSFSTSRRQAKSGLNISWLNRRCTLCLAVASSWLKRREQQDRWFSEQDTPAQLQKLNCEHVRPIHLGHLRLKTARQPIKQTPFVDPSWLVAGWLYPARTEAGADHVSLSVSWQCFLCPWEHCFHESGLRFEYSHRIGR